MYLFDATTQTASIPKHIGIDVFDFEAKIIVECGISDILNCFILDIIEGKFKLMCS